MRFGNTWETLRKAVVGCTIVGAVIGVLVGVTFVICEKAPWSNALPVALMLTLLVPTMICVAIAPTLLFSIHIVGEMVEHRLLDRYVLTRARVRDFRQMKSPAGIFAAVLYFKDGKKMRFLGANLGALSHLNSELSALRRMVAVTSDLD